MPRIRRRSLLAALASLALPGVRRALADERPVRQVGLHTRDGWLGVSVGLRDLFGPDDAARLRSGFVVRVVIQVELFRVGLAKAVARQDRHTEILYDLWDERFRLRVVERSGDARSEVATVTEAIEAATAFKHFGVAGLGDLDPRATYRFRFRADLNPLSEDLVADVRRWLVKSPGQGRSGTGDSVFGSFVSFFVNPRIEDSERQITFWSQPFSVALPEAGR